MTNTASKLFKRLSYSNQEGTAIDAEREDGSIKGIQPIDLELWELATNGAFGPIEAYVPPPEPPFEQILDTALGIIDRGIGQFRRQFITDIPGQQMVYLRKQKVAEEYLAEEDPDPEQFPRIMAAVGIVADTPRGVAEVWAAKAAEWEQADILIESRREAFKKRLNEASSKEEVESIIQEFKNWSI